LHSGFFAASWPWKWRHAKVRSVSEGLDTTNLSSYPTGVLCFSQSVYPLLGLLRPFVCPHGTKRLAQDEFT